MIRRQMKYISLAFLLCLSVVICVSQDYESLLISNAPFYSVDHPSFDQDHDGVCEAEDIIAAEAYADDNGGDLYFPTGTYTLDDNVTISSNVNVRFEQGAILAQTASETFTVYSPENLVVPPRQKITAVAMLSFTSGGTVHPGWWGAVGDGSNDDTAAIQAAIAAAEAVGGGTIKLPAGSFLHTNLTINSDNIKLQGAGRMITKLLYNSATGNNITISDASTEYADIFIGDMWLAVNSGVTRTSGSALYANNLKYSRLENLYLSDFYNGITLNGGTRVEIDSVWYQKENRASQHNRAIEILYNASGPVLKVPTNIKISRCEASGNAGWLETGIFIDSCDWVNVLASHFNQGDYGFKVTHTNTISDFWTTDSYFDSAVIANGLFSGADADTVKNVYFINTYFRDSGGRGISFEQTAVIDIVAFFDCRFRLSDEEAFYMDSENITQLKIHDSIFSDSATDGVDPVILSKAKFNNITENQFHSCDGTYMVSASRAVLEGTFILKANDFANNVPATDFVSYTNFARVHIWNNPRVANVSYETSELTISSGGITVLYNNHRIDTEGDAGSDDLDTVNGMQAGMYLLLRPENTDRTIVVKHGTGNISLSGGSDFTMDSTNDFLLLFSPIGTTCYQVASSSNE